MKLDPFCTALFSLFFEILISHQECTVLMVWPPRLCVSMARRDSSWPWTLYPSRPGGVLWNYSTREIEFGGDIDNWVHFKIIGS
jgi:hypothetical protein